jgi:hypothetical protein
MCVHHLLGEHLEMHMFVGCINKGISLNGYISKGLVDISLLKKRHDELVTEMLSRGYKHNSPLNFNPDTYKCLCAGRIDAETSLKVLLARCGSCSWRAEQQFQP